MSAPNYDCIVIGAGAAGLYYAYVAGRRGQRVLVLEHNREIGAKILISGGGRCNFTNLHSAPENFLSKNPDFCRSALARHPPAAFIALVQQYGIAYYEKTRGQLFCEGAGSARKIVGMLCDNPANVDIRTACSVSSVSKDDLFRVETSLGAFRARALIIATGGLSIPKLGAGDFAHRIARQFGLGVIPPRPGLVPLTFGASDLAWMSGLSGVSAEAGVAAGGIRFNDSILFTHRGLSGPAILQASSYMRAPLQIAIDWFPSRPISAFTERKRERPKALLKTILAEWAPARLAETLSTGLPQGALGDVSDKALTEAAGLLKAWPLFPIGTEGFGKAEVTLGGVDVNEISQKTMEARKVSGLYFIGEAVDVTGWLGGHNFQWAWSSAHAAANAAPQ